MSTATGLRLHGLREKRRTGDQLDVADFTENEKIPAPKYRHAAPSAPWPWMDFTQDKADVHPLPPGARETWTDYPQSHFGNWTPDQVERCRMLTICQDRYACKIHKVDVLADGIFDRSSEEERTVEIASDPKAIEAYWKELEKPFDSKYRVRVLFVENMTLSVLKILGARYDIEPTYFASSANWIPSRYQENPLQMGDHITVVLPFIRTVNNKEEIADRTPSNPVPYPPEKGAVPLTDKNQTIDTQAPLVLSDEKILLQDLLAIHMVRSTEQNIIISYHHNSSLQKTTAKRLQSLVQRTGDSVYWQKLYEKSRDPTFVFLATLWYALYAWDETMEVLYTYFSELESFTAIDHRYTRELHKLQAHLLYYEQLLREFKDSVEFVRDTLNPAMCQDSVTDEERDWSMRLLDRESNTLLSGILRLEKNRQMISSRLWNAMQLATTEAAKQSADAAVRESSAMKQIAYVTIMFLPATYLASVFGMHLTGMDDTLFGYIGSTIALTVLVIWVIGALHDFGPLQAGEHGIVRRIAWPIFYLSGLIQEMFGTWQRHDPSPV